MEDFKELKEGTVVKGKVVRKADGDVFVDINYKSEGIIPKDETIKYTYFDQLKEGDELEVYIKRIDGNEGNVLLSKIIVDKKVIFNNIRKAYKEHGSIDGKVTKAVKGGYIVDFGANVTAFLPISHVKSYEGDAIDKVLHLKVMQIDEERRNVVVSYKEYVIDKQQAEEGKIKTIFPVGEKIQLTITEVKDNGLEAEKEGIKCFIPVHEVSWARIRNLKEKFKTGDVVDVLVLGIERDKILLSMRKLTENPFMNFIKDKKAGDKINVKVKEVLNEGLLVELSPDLDGFVHISELSYLRRIKNVGEYYKAGDEINVIIVKIDDQESKIYLSVKRAEKNPWSSMEERYPANAWLVGTVKEIKEGEGASIEIEENVDAFVQTSNISWFSFNKIEDVLKVGDKKEFRILGIDKAKYRILLGLKQMETSPWESFMHKYKEGSFIDVKILEIDDTAILCQIVEGVNGRLPIKNKNKIPHKKGDIIKAKINKIDKDQKKVYLSSKELESLEEKKEVDNYIKTHEHKITMNDIVNFGDVEKQEEKQG